MPDSTSSTPQMKRCSRCGEDKPLTREHFYYDKTAKSGFQPRCIQCGKAYYHPLERQQYYIDNKERIQQYRKDNRDKLRVSGRRYYELHRDHYRELNRHHYLEHREKILERKRITGPESRQRNADVLRERHRKWRMANINRCRLAGSKRRARVRSLPATFTHEQWLFCLEYWHNRCAVCERQLRDLFGKIEPHFDHWIPITNAACPGTTADNMVCLCSDCNLSKHDKMPDVWLTRRYGGRKAAAILRRVEAYFKIAASR
jgi:hypothetical protein